MRAIAAPAEGEYPADGEGRAGQCGPCWPVLAYDGPFSPWPVLAYSGPFGPVLADVLVYDGPCWPEVAR